MMLLLKKIFNRNITCGQEVYNHIVFRSHYRKRIRVNRNIVVPDNCACVVAYRGRVCDIINPGKHRFCIDKFPELFSKARIKANRYSFFSLRRVMVDLYYVNLIPKDKFAFTSDVPFVSKSKELGGRVKGYLKGDCTIRVFDAKKLVKALIYENGKESNSEVNIDIGLWIGNAINKIIEKKKISTNQILTNQSEIEPYINEDIIYALDKIGIYVTNVKLLAVDLPKKVQEKVNTYMSSNRTNIKRAYNINEGANNTHNSVTVSNSTNNRASSNSSKVSITRNIQQGQMYNGAGLPIGNVKISNSVKVESKLVKCSVCGKDNKEKDKLCQYCGSKLR